MVQCFCVEVFRPEHQLLRVEEFRTNERQNKAFQRHAVVSKKAAEGEGKRSQDADPADLPAADDIPQAKVHGHSYHDGQQGEQELAQRQPEEQALLVVPDFFVDAYFYGLSPLNLKIESADRPLQGPLARAKSIPFHFRLTAKIPLHFFALPPPTATAALGCGGDP